MDYQTEIRGMVENWVDDILDEWRYKDWEVNVDIFMNAITEEVRLVTAQLAEEIKDWDAESEGEDE